MFTKHIETGVQKLETFKNQIWVMHLHTFVDFYQGEDQGENNAVEASIFWMCDKVVKLLR